MGIAALAATKTRTVSSTSVLDAGDPDLIEENLDELSESFFLTGRQRSKKGDVRLEEPVPTMRGTVVS